MTDQEVILTLSCRNRATGAVDPGALKRDFEPIAERFNMSWAMRLRGDKRWTASDINLRQ
jgi:hypothetical protein